MDAIAEGSVANVEVVCGSAAGQDGRGWIVVGWLVVWCGV